MSAKRSKRLTTAIATMKRATKALDVAAKAEGLVPCDEDGGDRCNFPLCLAYGCEPELAETCAATPKEK